MNKIKYFAFTLGGFVVNLLPIPIICYMPSFALLLKFPIFVFGIQIVVSAGAVNALFSRQIRVKLGMKSTVYSIFANALPLFSAVLILSLLVCGAFNLKGYGGLALGFLLFISCFMLITTVVLGYVFQRTILKD